MTLQNGYLLKGRYRIVDILGQGGMGAVYRAVDENLDTTVAIKENSFFSEDYARQFQREAKVLASLRHPNLPRVFDYFIIQGQAQYLVMDYIEGEDLRQWMANEEGVTESETLQIGIAICNALTYLHSRVPAITHRDIKPGNIKITPGGEIVLVDFGLVKVMHEKEVTTEAARAMTPGYSPPEQYGQAPTDQRSDIFALGATLYAILAGYLPEDSLARTTGKTQLTPLRSYQPYVSRRTADTIEKALNLRFEDRWQSAETFKNELIKAYTALPTAKRTSSRLPPIEQPGRDNTESPPETSKEKDHHRIDRLPIIQRLKSLDPVWLIFSAIIILLLLVLVISLNIPPGLQGIFRGVLVGDPTPTQSEGHNPTETIDQLPISLAETEAPTPQPSPTSIETTPLAVTPSPTPIGGGSGLLAYVSERSGIPQIWLLDVTSRETTQLTDVPDGACQPDWSPDGKQIVVTSPCSFKRERYPGSGLMLLDVESGTLTSLPTSLEGDFDPAWSPDGVWIAYTTLVNGRRQLAKINLQDLSITRLSDGAYRDFSPAWSSDGTRLAFVRIRNVGQIWLMDANGDNAAQFSLSGMIDNSNPAWFPDGSMILFSQALGLGSPSKQLYGMRLEDIGQSKEYPIIPRMRLDYIPLMDNVDVSPDGFWLAFDYWYFGMLSDIYLMTFPGANLTQLTDHPGLDYDPVWAPLP
jgi:eukaryotic-like serine/threonine-protein kinase